MNYKLSGNIASLALLMLSINTAFACDFCLLQQGISPLESVKGAGIRLTQRNTVLDSVYQGTHKIDNPGTHEEFWTTDINGFYSLSDDVLVMANIPYRKTQVDGHLHVHDNGVVELHDDKGGDEGLGDITLLSRITLSRQHTLDSTTLFALTGGIKLPTGSTHGRTDDGEYLDAHTQLGTGSYDLLAGPSVNYSKGKYSVSGNALFIISGSGDAGDTKHGFGDAINYDLTSRYRLSPDTIGTSPNSYFASLGLVGELRGKEKEDGNKLADSGGNTVYLTPGIQMNFGPQWSAELSYQQAVYHDLNSTQLGENHKIFGSVMYLF